MLIERKIFCFISDKNKRYYRTTQSPDGTYSISKNVTPKPLAFNPVNLLESQVEMATNQTYLGLFRTISYPLQFVKDGAAILRQFYHKGRGISHDCFLTIIEWSSTRGLYELSYYGKLDLSEKDEDPKSGSFTVPTIDDSALGLVLENDKTIYSVDCSPSNPKAIKVLFDNITLLNNILYQNVNAAIVNNHVTGIASVSSYTLPFVMINQDGDTSGLIFKDQTLIGFNPSTPGWIPPVNTGFVEAVYDVLDVRISGTYAFTWTNTNSSFNYNLELYFTKNTTPSLATRVILFQGNLVPGKTYNIPFDFTIDILQGEELFFAAMMFNFGSAQYTITPTVTNVNVSTSTKSQPAVAYGLRPLDLLQDLVSQATRGRFTIQSSWFTTNNKDIAFAGDSIRGIQNARIYSSFQDFFKTFDSIYFMGLKVVDGDLFMEKVIDIYKQTTNIIDVGEIIDLKLKPAKEHYYNELVVGSPKQDYRHASGRLEFNSENTFSFPITNVNKKLDLVTKYRLGCFDILFLIMDYRGASTKDNSGDKSVYLAKITDNKGTASQEITTFENINVVNAPLAPIIKSPLNNDVIYNNLPTIKGIAPVGSTVNIYVFDTLDGSTIADANGNWVYNIVTPLDSYDPGVATGQHDIVASFTTVVAPTDTISIVVNTIVPSPVAIVYPLDNDSLWNNKPLFKGVAPAGTLITLTLNTSGVIGTVTADGSCKWEFKSPVLFNGSHILSINAGADTAPFVVDNTVDYPIITYIGSELDGFNIINNLPLIEGVSMPNAIVEIWLNYIPYGMLGQTTANAMGNWSFQVVPVTYIDPATSLPVILAPIRNGISTVSTSLINHSVGVNVTGYLLSRPPYSLISGVTDNTVFNTEYSPQRMLMSRYPWFAGMLDRMTNEVIKFQTADKNSAFATVLNGVQVAESADIPYSSLGSKMVVMENAHIKVNAMQSFAKTLYHFNNGGLVKGVFRGSDIFMLPIGSMKMDSIASSIQEWKLLIAPATTFDTLLNLYKNGLIITLMDNAIYHSDENTLHMVTYGLADNPKYKSKSMYDDFFENRNEAWISNPPYIQKMQRSDTLKDQILTKGVSDIHLDLYRCKTALLVDTTPYLPVTPSPVQTPYVVYEAEFDMTTYPEDEYFTVMRVDTLKVAISEHFVTSDSWLKTVLIESSHSLNQPTFFYSTGIKTVIRVDGIVKKIQPALDTIVSKNEDGDSATLYSQLAKKRVIRYGTAYGLPDYLAIKVANGLKNDYCLVDGTHYSMDPSEKMDPSEDIDGHPLYYYNVNMTLATNERGAIFSGVPGGGGSSPLTDQGVVLVVDALAFGIPGGSLVTIDLDSP